MRNMRAVSVITGTLILLLAGIVVPLRRILIFCVIIATTLLCLVRTPIVVAEPKLEATDQTMTFVETEDDLIIAEEEMNVVAEAKKPWLKEHPEMRGMFVELTTNAFEQLLERGMNVEETQALQGKVIVSPLPEGTYRATSYPSYSILLPVPWLKQAPPCDNSGNITTSNSNCGQTCAAMLGSYFNRTALSADVIRNENRYMGKNDCGSGGTGANQLMWLLRSDFHKLQCIRFHGNHADDIVGEMAKGRPVVFGCRINGGELSTSGRDHWSLAVGYNGRIITNDPGSSRGHYKSYDINRFESSWRSGYNANVYIPVTKPPSVNYSAHVSNIGWMLWVGTGATAGVPGRGQRIEALRISVPGTTINYQAHVQNIGWMPWKSNGEVAGTVGRALQMEAIRITCPNFKVRYRAYVGAWGWQRWVSDGEMSGSTGQGRPIEAIQIRLDSPW